MLEGHMLSGEGGAGYGARENVHVAIHNLADRTKADLMDIKTKLYLHFQ